MVLHAILIHTATIQRPDQTIVARKKSTTITTVATNVECLIEPVSDAAQITILGRTASEAYQGTFPGGTDLQNGDRILWTDRSLTFLVEGAQERADPAFQDLDSHVEAQLKRMEVS